MEWAGLAITINIQKNFKLLKIIDEKQVTKFFKRMVGIIQPMERGIVQNLYFLPNFIVLSAT